MKLPLFLGRASHLFECTPPAPAARRARRACPELPAPALVLVVMFAVACSPAGPNGAAHGFSVTSEDGVEVALTTGGPRHEGEIFAYERTLVIRPDPAIAESVMYSPYWMAMAEDGRIFVGDMGDRQVVVFSAEGEYLYRIGRRGQGPGEFQRVTFVDVDGDVLWVTDGYRNHAFELDGTFIETFALPTAALGLMRDGRWWRLPDGRGVIFNLEERYDRFSETRAEMHVIGPEGEPRASIVTPWVVNGEFLLEEDGSRGEWLQHYFAGRPWGDFSRRFGFRLVNPLEPEVRVYDDEGALVGRLRVELPPEPVTDEDRARVMEQLDDAVRRAEAGETGYQESRGYRLQRDNPRFADPKHYWSRPIVDDKGFVWLSIDHVRDLPEGSYRWAVFSPEGEYLGQTTTPGWPQPQRGHLLIRWEDPESGEVFPVVYRIRSMVEGVEY
jgi:hypothetical protein